MVSTKPTDPEAARRRRALSILGLLWLGGIGCMGAAALLVHAGGILFVGGLIAFFAPDLFLLGLVLLAAGVCWIFTNRLLLIVPGAIAIGIVLGLNSRLPEALHDLRTDWFSVDVAQRLSGQTGQRLGLPAASLVLNARTFAYATVRQQCKGDGCFLTEGFRTPYPHIPSEYWSETPASAALEVGFTLAQPKEPAPTLEVSTSTEAGLLVVDMKLLGVDGSVWAKGVARYRNGFSGEPADEARADGSGSKRLFWQYLLHANVVNRALGPKLAPTVEFPVHVFLQRATTLVNPQDSKAPVTVVDQQLLESQRFDPPKIVHGGGEHSERSALFFDKERDERCKTALRQESEGPVTQVWWLFVNDPSGRHKLRITGPRLCDADAIWLFDHASMGGHTLLAKYDLEGNLLYRIALKRPQGESSFIREPSLRAQGGMLEFERWSGSDSASDFHATAIDRVRVKEPGS